MAHRTGFLSAVQGPLIIKGTAYVVNISGIVTKVRSSDFDEAVGYQRIGGGEHCTQRLTETVKCSVSRSNSFRIIPPWFKYVTPLPIFV